VAAAFRQETALRSAAEGAESAVNSLSADQHAARAAGQELDIPLLARLDSDIRSSRNHLVAAEKALSQSARKTQQARAHLEVAGRAVWGSERALDRVRREETLKARRQELREMQERPALKRDEEAA
jgi:hypothetical protein